MTYKNNFNRDEIIVKNAITYGLAFFTMIIFLKLYLSDTINLYITENITESNIIPYTLLIVIFIIVVIAYNFILSHLSIIQYINKCNSEVANIIGIIIFLLNTIILGYVYFTELNTFDAPTAERLKYHLDEKATMVIITIILFAVIYYIESNKETMELRKHNKLIFYIFVMLVAVIYGYTLYTPNCFSTYANMHHSDAYFNSVYHIMMGAPRSYLNTGVYGCYSIIIAPFVKLIGGTLSSFSIIVAILGGLSIVSMAYSIDVMVKNPIIKVLGTISLTVPVMVMQWSIYPQIFPHRTLFPSILIAYMVCIYKNNRNKMRWSIGGYILSTFSIVWNIEIGIVCLIAWLAFKVYDKFVEYSFKQKELYKNLGIHISLSVFSFMGALFFVNIVNILMGGKLISLKNFLFPLLTSDYMEGFLKIPLPKILTTWVWVLGLFLLLLTHCIMKTKLNPIRSSYSPKDNVFFGVSVLGMGQLIYYINRTAYGNLSIVHYITIFVLCILTDWSLQKYASKTAEESKILKYICRSISYITLTALVLVVVGGISNYFQVESYKRGLEYRETYQVEVLVNTIKESIPKDTRAIGNGTAEIYSYLNWDTYYHVIDFSDLGVLPDAAKYLNNELTNLKTPILINPINLATLDTYSANSNQEFYNNNVLIKTFKIYDFEFCYYEPK